jgi:peptide/nickel transport system substrate-binding protein
MIKWGINIICLVLMASCQFKVPKDPYTLIYPIPADVDTLNPIISADHTQRVINEFIYEQLVRINKDTTQAMPSLAEKWEISEDKLQITFFLRKNAIWHDGVPFTAEDVLYSYEQIQNPEVDASALRSDYINVSKLEILDPYIVRFTFKKPDFKGIIVSGTMRIVPKHIYNDGNKFNSHPAGRFPVGTGPYKFVEWNTGRKIVVERNENYWGLKPDIKKVEFKIVGDSSALFQTLKKGELDFGTMRPIQMVKQANTPKFNEQFNKYEYYLPFCFFIGWNMKKPYFEDANVRIALTHLINRAGINEKLYFGKAKGLATCFDINSSLYDETIKPYPYDPETAKKLLSAAGWVDRDKDGILDKGGLPFKFIFSMIGGDAATSRVATMIREDFLKAGIVMDIQQFEWATFLQQIDKKDFDACWLAWAFNPTSDPYEIWHSSQIESGSNFVEFKNDEMDRLLVDGQDEFDEAKRKEIYSRVQQILHEEEPYTVMYAPASLVAIDKRFENVKVHALGINPREWRVKK